MFVRVLERAMRIHGVHAVVAAIPDEPEDDRLAALATATGIEVFRGSSSDVLSRYVGAAHAAQASVVMRITADCPLLSPSVSGRVLEAFGTGSSDYASNTIRRTWPQGLDTEVVRTTALERADRETRDATDREHVTRYVWRHPDRFALRSVEHEGPDLSANRWTVDEPADLQFAQAIYDELWDGNRDFDLQDVLDLLDRRPELTAINRTVRQRHVE